MSGSILKVGIIGQGRSGRNIHAETIRKLPDRFALAAVSDELEQRRQAAERDYGCEAYADYRDMMKRDDLDLIVNATPSHLHVPVSLELLEAGFNVLCEKPLARRSEEVDALIAARDRAGTLLTIFQQWRFNPLFLEIHKCLDSGVLGRIVQIGLTVNQFSRRWDWQTLKAYNGGNLMNTGAHFLDQALQFLGTDDLPSVLCRMDNANSFGDADDYCKLILTGPRQPTIDLEISNCCAYPISNYYLIQGTNGSLRASLTEVEWKYFKPEEAPRQELQQSPMSDADGNPLYCKEQLKWYVGGWEKGDGSSYPAPQIAFYESLHASLTEGKPPAVTPESVWLQIRIMEECFRQNPMFAIEPQHTRH
ncbi:Gfo/Idh/MocA family oxidoreductase [Paenibacillus hemerocallicola]|uniref:Gfo/Idh/MocA family oxidoreductase n=1 Tax=Paenibacillus hemerocallicola TaxID=1172614 RepID=A0A5C4T0A5_9BACL|nr:Gfo/Idh/MocA family oxidoreductase [Paenibacillus hemerocallicola]TNJ61012.1 Gfo/Idh/MocA family oxidoreductase [Paenibacillus hemerocallicola]